MRQAHEKGHQEMGDGTSWNGEDAIGPRERLGSYLQLGMRKWAY